MCAEIGIHKESSGLLSVQTPFTFPDGDPYQLYIKEMPSGILRLSDMGNTIMRLSYDNDTAIFRAGTRGKIFEQIQAECQVREDNGEFYVDTTLDDLAANVFRLGQALTKLYDLTFLNRFRVESTFYEDLEEQLFSIVDSSKIEKNYLYPAMENAADYPIDYRIEGKYLPLYLFGVPGKDKARLTTIVLERLLRSNHEFDSLLIFSDQSLLPKGDLARLTNAGGEMIASLDARDDLRRKILRKVA